MPVLNVRKLLDDLFGGDRAAHAEIVASGIEGATPEMVRKWRDRNSIPAVWFATLCVLHLARGGSLRDLGSVIEGVVMPCQLNPKSASSGSAHPLFG